MAKKFTRTRPDSGQRNRKKKKREPIEPKVKPIQQMKEAGDKAAAAAHVLETKHVKASDLVGADHDKFPPRTGSAPPPGSQPGASGSAAPTSRTDGHAPGEGATAAPATPPARRPGGRPPGSKDSKPRGRPARPDWPNKSAEERRNGSAEEFSAGRPAAPLPPIEDPVRQAHAELAAPDYRPLACILVDMGMGACCEFLGPRWKPSKAPMEGLPDERENMIIQLTKYLEANHIKDIPPGVMLAIAIGGYAIPRAVMQVREYLKKRRETSTSRQPTNSRPNGSAQPEKKKDEPAQKPAEQVMAEAAAVPNRDLGPDDDSVLLT